MTQLPFTNITSFRRFNKILFHRCRRHDYNIEALTPEEQRHLTSGFVQYSPKLVGYRTHELQIGFARNRVTGHGVFTFYDGQSLITVGRKCTRKNPHHSLREAMRGSIVNQIKIRSRPGCDVDHSGVGFARLCDQWIAKSGYSQQRLLSCIKKYNPLEPHDCFVSLTGPPHDEWSDYHRRHAVLQTIPRDEHRRLTRKRARLLTSLASAPSAL